MSASAPGAEDHGTRATAVVVPATSAAATTPATTPAMAVRAVAPSRAAAVPRRPRRVPAVIAHPPRRVQGRSLAVAGSHVVRGMRRGAGPGPVAIRRRV